MNTTEQYDVTPKDENVGGEIVDTNYIDLNAMLNLYDDNGNIQLDKDKEAARQYFLQYVNPNTVFFYTLEEKIDYLIDNNYYDGDMLGKYDFDFVKELFKFLYNKKFRFESFIGALKFYTQYAMRTNDGKRFLERYEDRVAMVSLHLGDGDPEMAKKIADNIISGRFQPATPTFLNAGKKRRGELVSCFILRTEDNMESITTMISDSMQLSKRGGGVGICLTNLRERNAPIKGLDNAASGVIPVAKILEDAFSYANQLGQRQGAGAVYISAAHPDMMDLLDTKRENADEKIRIKSLSIGIVIPDILFDLAKANKDMYQFSPFDVEKEYGKPMSDISITDNYYDMVENKNIRKKKVSARKIFQTIAELQFESGYPYLMFEDTVNQWHQASNARVSSSNLCSEILQGSSPAVYDESGFPIVEGEDISCNLASLNVSKTMRTSAIGDTVNVAIKALTQVSDSTSIKAASSVRAGNESTHSVGLGAMNLHGFLASEKIMYGSEEALDIVNAYFGTVKYHALSASCEIARQRGETYRDFKESEFYSADGSLPKGLSRYYEGVWLTTPQTPKGREVFEKYNQPTPTPEDWRELAQRIGEYGLYNAYLLATAPTGSISYVNYSTSSIHPITSKIEIRKEGKIGRVYAPAPEMTTDNMDYFVDAYTLGYKPIIDTYAVAQKHIDQGQSLTMFFEDTATTRDLNRAYIYAWSKKYEKDDHGGLAIDNPATAWKSGFIKTMYYSRIRQAALSGTEAQGCISCSI